MTVQEALATGTRLLQEAGIDGAGRDARLLLAHRLGLEPGRLTLHLRDDIGEMDEVAYYDLILDRQARRPLSHIIGYRTFYGRRFTVSSDVLDPRGDTETLIEAALSLPFGDVLDLGTGTGCILLTLLAERPEAKGIGTDVSATALSIAGMNAKSLGIEARCDLLQSDWFQAVGGRFDLIVSNPPYIAAEEMEGLAPELAYEPRGALTDEGDGLSAYRVITGGARSYLRPGGRLMLEIGATQGEAVRRMFLDAGYADVQILPDLEGRDRVVQGRNPVN